MGAFAEAPREAYQFTREEQDAYAIESLTRARKAVEGGAFKAEIAPVTVTGKGGDARHRQGRAAAQGRSRQDPDAEAGVRAGRHHHAGDFLDQADGAAALVLTRAIAGRARGMPIAGRWSGHATHAQEPDWFTTAPVRPIRKVLDKAGWSVDDVDLFEINEAFAVVAMAAKRELGIPRDKLNVNGGACALGHPDRRLRRAAHRHAAARAGSAAA